MADLKKLETALINAHAAGDEAGARILAQEIKRMRGNEDAAARMISGTPEIDPTEGMSTTQKVLAGAGMGITNAARGVGNLVGLVSDEEIAEAKRLDAPLANTTAGTVGNVLGSAAALAPVALMPGANTIAGAGLYGAGTGFVTTPGNMAERGQAAFMGGAGGMLGQSLPAAYRTLKASVEPLTKKGQDKILARVLREAAGDNADVVAARLKSAAPLIPGSNPTAAEVAESGGIAALQRAMSAADPEAYTQRAMEQSSARMSALRGIAKDDAALTAAKAARDSASSGLYDQALEKAVTRTPDLDALLSRPIMQQAKARAAELAANNGERFVLEVAEDARPAIVDATGMLISSAKGANPGSYSARGLHYLKLALDDIGSGQASTALGRNQMRALGDNRAKLLEILDASVPEYAAARKAFAEGSRPVNQMKIGQALQDKVSPALSDYGALGKETGARYAQALRNADDLASNLTGSRGGIESVMTPDQMDTLRAVAQDLARKSNAQDLGRGVGSNTFQNFAMNNLAQSNGMPSAVSGLFNLVPMASRTAGAVTSAGKAIGNVLYKSKDEAMRARMAQALLNPQETAGLMELALTQPGRLAQLLRSPTVQAIPGVAGMALPAAQ